MRAKMHLPLTLAALTVCGIGTQLAFAADSRSYTGGRFQLDVDGKSAGLIRSIDGGAIKAEVIVEKVDNVPGTIAHKHVGQPKYGDIKVSMLVSSDTSPGIHEWIESTLAMKYQRKSGELQAADFKRDVRQVREFKDALLTEIGFPACDASSKDPAYMTLKFAPETTRNIKGSGKIENPVDVRQKMWIPANFRLSIEGLDEDSRRVSKIEAFTVKQSTATDEVGDARDYQREPGKIDFPDLKISFPVGGAPGFQEWAEANISVQGGNGKDTPKELKRSGLLEYYDGRTGRPLFSVSLHGVGIYKYVPISGPSGDSTADSEPETHVGLYVEQMLYHPGQVDKKFLEKLFSQSRNGKGQWVGFGVKTPGPARGIASEKRGRSKTR